MNFKRSFMYPKDDMSGAFENHYWLKTPDLTCAGVVLHMQGKVLLKTGVSTVTLVHSEVEIVGEYE